MADIGDRIRDFLETELVIEPTEADRQARYDADYAIGCDWYPAFWAVAPVYLGLVRTLCHGNIELMLKILDASAWDSALYDPAPGDAPLPDSPMTVDEQPAAAPEPQLTEAEKDAVRRSWDDSLWSRSPTPRYRP